MEKDKMNIMNETEREDTQKSPKSACPICEAFGFSGPCKGHGGGGSGSGDDAESDKDENSHADSMSQIIISLVLRHPSPGNSSKTASPAIACIAHNPAILSIDMDVDNLTLVFSRNTLSIKDFNKLKALLQNAIEAFKIANPDQAEQLSGISFTANAEKIIIQMPSMKLFNAFVKQLMHDNLLPGLRLPATNPERQHQSSPIDDGMSAHKEVHDESQNEIQTPSQSTAPTPFNMQPTPAGYSNE